MSTSATPKTIASLADCEPDRANANKHTPRGTALMETSIREYGYGDSMTVDKHGRIISGNQRAETLADLQMTDAIVVQSDGTKPIIHQRVDLDLATDIRAKGLAALEIVPTFCQVIIDRWEAFTGSRAVKVGDAVQA